MARLDGPVASTGFEYSNLSGRRPGPFVTAASLLSRGVREVQAQVVPYAHAWERHNRTAAAQDGPLWVTLGDSMAQGVGASSYDMGWAGQLAGLIDGRLCHVNLSVYGGRVEDLLERQLPVLESLARSRGAPPALVTVIIGSNDLFSRAARARLPERLTTLLQRLPTRPATTTVMATQPGGSPAALAFNGQVDEAGARGRLTVADFRRREMQDWRGKLSPDHFHPNDRGYAGMAALMARAVTRSRPDA